MDLKHASAAKLPEAAKARTISAELFDQRHALRTDKEPWSVSTFVGVTTINKVVLVNNNACRTRAQLTTLDVKSSPTAVRSNGGGGWM